MKLDEIKALASQAYQAWRHFGDEEINEESELERIVAENENVKSSLEASPMLFDDRLRRIYRETKEERIGLYKAAARVDLLDRIIAPLQLGAQYAGSGKVFGILKAQEIVVKLGFAAKYLIQTSDYEGLLAFAANETIGYFVKYGSAINMYNLYKERVKKSMRDRSASEYEKRVLGICIDLRGEVQNGA